MTFQSTKSEKQHKEKTDDLHKGNKNMEHIELTREQVDSQVNSQKMVVCQSLEGKVLHVARVNVEEVVARLEGMVSADTGINELILERIPINTIVESLLMRLLRRTDRTWRYLKLVDCIRESLDERDGVVRTAFDSSLFNIQRLFLQTATNNRDTNLYFLPVEASLWVPSLRLCISNLDETLADTLVSALKSTTTLAELSLSGSRRCGLQIAKIAEALEVNQSLVKLDFGDCMLNDHGMSRLVAALQGHAKLKRLDLSNNSWSDQTLLALNGLLLKGNCGVEVLDLSLQRCPLNVSLLAPALAQPNSGLKQLYLSNCGLNDEGTFPIIDSLTQNRTLEILDLSTNRQLSDRFLIYLAGHLPQLTLKQLNIRKLQPPNGSLAAMTALSEGMRQNTSIQILRLLSWKQLRPAHLIQIYVNLNRGGRRALEEKIPLALWPLVFERAHKRFYFCPFLKQPNAKEDAMFHLFRNEPALWRRNG